MLSLTTTTQKACAVNTGHTSFSCLGNRLKRRFFFFVVRYLTTASVMYPASVLSPPHSFSCWWTPPSRLLELQPQRSFTIEKLLDSIPSRNYILSFQANKKVPSWQDLCCLRVVWETFVLSLINERTFAGRSGWAARQCSALATLPSQLPKTFSWAVKARPAPQLFYHKDMLFLNSCFRHCWGECRTSWVTSNYTLSNCRGFVLKKSPESLEFWTLVSWRTSAQIYSRKKPASY